MLYHFSEEDTIDIFHPRKHQSFPDRPPMVWAIDGERSPLYLFPRDCPRIGFWATPETSAIDREKYLHTTSADKIIAIESGWLERLEKTKLYRYSFAPDHFTIMDEGAGYFVSYETEHPLEVKPVGSLLEALVKKGVELRILPSLTPLSDQLPKTTLHYSMIRMRNAIK
ncbi:DUF6886 family protein [Fictibacillus phosphorivorans]|uniref:DUF6886 family protein n=1 Tax=Fictibacillus phosphorivorans TaxID=1221500 RepID=UPI00203C59DA|nr:DUF6886 family protein [Fictibacillus phosphorivorans]MCM3719408.1 hypothetical protein [Fictibacillus phosphorivorans]MCM3777114.1 hypothetical protein [Fictibacillus phosphorivorans]